MSSLVRVSDVVKVYYQGDTELRVLDSVSLDVQSGESCCIVGASGAGKSTLLHIIGALDSPTSGKVILGGQDLSKKSDHHLADIRNQKIGFVFQFHHLLPEFSALENVMMPCRIAGINERQSESLAKYWLERVGLETRDSHYPGQLSGGEQQRVAVARALVRSPSLLLADEPTGSLDSENSQKIEDLLFELRREHDLTLIVVTHNSQFSQRFSKVIELKDGKVVEGFSD